MAGFTGIGAGAGTASFAEPAAEDELPPPFTTGSFSDPLFEKLSDAARQRQELYRTTSSRNGSPLPPGRNDTGDTYESLGSQSQQSIPSRTTRTSQQELYNPYLNADASESENEEDEMIRALRNEDEDEGGSGTVGQRSCV